MSLEQALADATAAMKELTAALKAGGGKASSGGSSSTAEKKKTEKKLTIDAVAKKFSAYLASGGDEAKAKVTKLVKHFGVKKITALEEDQFDEALEMLAQIEDGEDPFEEDGGSLV